MIPPAGARATGRTLTVNASTVSAAHRRVVLLLGRLGGTYHPTQVKEQ